MRVKAWASQKGGWINTPFLVRYQQRVTWLSLECSTRKVPRTKGSIILDPEPLLPNILQKRCEENVDSVRDRRPAHFWWTRRIWPLQIDQESYTTMQMELGGWIHPTILETLHGTRRTWRNKYPSWEYHLRILLKSFSQKPKMAMNQTQKFWNCTKYCHKII